MILTRTPHGTAQDKKRAGHFADRLNCPTPAHGSGASVAATDPELETKVFGRGGVQRPETHEYGVIVLASCVKLTTEGVAAPVVELTVSLVWMGTRFPSVNRSSWEIAVWV